MTRGAGVASRHQTVGATVSLALLLLTVPGTPAAQNTVPQLVVEAPDALTAAADRVRGFDPDRLSGIMTLTGLRDAGAPIRVLLLPETWTGARDIPPWVAAFADAERDLVVVFPGRIGSYPYRSLESVVYHEVAHILTARAAAGAPVPRWFNEGLASAAERTWGLEDRSRFAWEVFVGGRLSPTELEGLFGQGRGEVSRAYVLADALVRDLLQHHGPDTPARILSRMAQGVPFEVALYATTGSSVDGVISRFWRRHDVWKSWISFVGHPFTQWSLITILALAAIWKHRRKRLARRRRWELEEHLEQQEWEEHRRRYRVH